LNIKEFLKIKINYLGIVIRSILFLSIYFFLILINFYIFWNIYGGSTTSDKISELLYVNLIVNYLPNVIIGGFLVFRIIEGYKNKKYVNFKTNLLTLVVLLILFFFKSHVAKWFV